jgi:hypothetical protein
VEHKTGTLNGYTGDVGFLTLADGRRIAVVFFARGGSNRPAVISTAARAIYDGFSGAGLAGLTGGRVVQAGFGSTAAAGLPQYGPPARTCTLGGQAIQANC